MQFILEGEGRVDDDQAGAGQTGQIPVAFHRQFCAEHLGNACFFQGLVESGNRRAFLDWIPEAIDTGGKPAIGPRQSVDQPFIFPVQLERWIDQHDTAFFLGRQMGAQRQPAIQFGDSRLVIAFEQPGKCAAIVRMQFHGRQTVLWTKQVARQLRRARIAGQTAIRVQCPHHVEIGLQHLRCCGRQLGVEQFADPAQPFTGFLRFV